MCHILLSLAQKCSHFKGVDCVRIMEEKSQSRGGKSQQTVRQK